MGFRLCTGFRVRARMRAQGLGCVHRLLGLGVYTAPCIHVHVHMPCSALLSPLSRTVRLHQAVLDNVNDELIGNQRPRVHVVLGLLPEIRSGLDLRSERIARRDVHLVRTEGAARSTVILRALGPGAPLQAILQATGHGTQGGSLVLCLAAS